MSLPLPAFFFAYISVFLAVILIAWLCFGWQRRRFEKSARARVACRCCGRKITAPEFGRRLHCPHCGAVQETSL